MTLHTQQSLSGFIAGDPQQTVTESGDTRFYVRIGQPHFRRDDDGSFHEIEPSFHDLVIYRATADRALTRLTRGDSFVAEGYVHTLQVERDGHAIDREEFVAKKIGHDLARTNYEVDRARQRNSAPQQEPEIQAGTPASATQAGSSALRL